MTLLTIITRTFNGRPHGLKRNRESVQTQVRSDLIQHLIVVDDQRRGVEWAQWNLRNVSPQIEGDYVMLLDDDDYLIDDYFSQDLIELVYSQPEVVVVKMDMSNGLTLPDKFNWQQPPVHSHIACSCYIVRRDVWLEHVTDFAAAYDGDFSFIESVYKHGHRLQWWDRVISKVGRTSHGSAESGGATAVGVSAQVAGALSG